MFNNEINTLKAKPKYVEISTFNKPEHLNTYNQKWMDDNVKVKEIQ